MSGSSIAHSNGVETAVSYEVGPDGKRKRIIDPHAVMAILTDAFNKKQNRKGGEDLDLGSIFTSAVASFSQMFSHHEDTPDAQPS